MNSLGCLGGPGFFGSGRVRVGPAMVWAGFGPGLRICGQGRPIARLGWRSKIQLQWIGGQWLQLCWRESGMILHLGQSLLPMERPSFSSGSKIRQEAENLHRGAEIRGTEKANYHFRQPTLSPRLLESVFATGQSVRPGQGRGRMTSRRHVPSFPELAQQEPRTRTDDIV